jgi:thiol-disulfide isomerase/thioredoxin
MENKVGGKIEQDFGEKYNKSDVIELKGINFKNKKITHSAFKNKFGFLKVYAPWCPHCTSMVDDMKFLGKELKKEDITIGALNSMNPNNDMIVKQLGVEYFPYLFMVKDDGALEHVDLTSHSVESILDTICKKTNEYVDKSIKKTKKAKCCMRDGNNIKC